MEDIDLLEYEKALYEEGYELICGTDEVGRGPLVGPVVAAAVILPKNYYLEGLTDSKKLSEKKRCKFYDIIIHDAISYGIGIVDAKTIDEINIYEASRLAMLKAIEDLIAFFKSPGYNIGSILFIIFLYKFIFLPANLNFDKNIFNKISETSHKSSIVYLLKSTTLSNLLIKALSKYLYKFVVAIKTTLSFKLSNPFNIADVARPISLKSFEFVLSNAIASISSNKTTIFSGLVSLFNSLNNAAMFFCVCPNLLSITAENSTENKSLSNILAICL